MLNERHVISAEAFAELVVWLLPAPLAGSRHLFKYRLALIWNGCCVLRYDNEAGKGDHKHVGDNESSYAFTTPAALIEDFWSEADQWSS